MPTKWENKGSMMGYAWRWWFDGTPPPGAEQEFDTAIWSQLIQKPSGSYVEDPFFDYYFFSCNDVMAAIKDFLHSGYGVSLLLYSNSASMNTVGHALTVWGYQAYADGTITKLWVTDSLKNTLNNLRELPVAYRANWIDNQLYGLKWRVTHDVAAAPYQGWLLPGAQALKSKQINFARVHKAGTGVGTVTSSDGKIACGADCLEAYSSPPTITLTATAGSGVTFTGWQGACSGSAPTCTLTVQGEKQVIAIFTLNTSPNYTITVNADTGVSVWPPSPVGVSKGDNATFVFLPTPPYQITEVLVDGVSQGPATSYTFSTVAANHQLTIHTLHKGSAYNVVLSKKCVNTDHEVINCPPGDNAIVKIGDKVCDAECMRIIGCAFGAVNLEVIPLGVNDFVCWEEADGACYSTSKTITVSGTFGARPVIECAGSD